MVDLNKDINIEQIPSLKVQFVSLQKSTKSFFYHIKESTQSFFKNNKKTVKYLLLILPIIAIFIVVGLLRREQSLKTGAVVHQANVSFQLSNWTLPPESTFGVWVNADSQVTYADVEISFDRSLVKLTSEVEAVGPLSRTVKISSMAEANTSGTISIIRVADPTNTIKPPSGAFQIANLKFNAITAGENVSTAITFALTSMQVVALDQTAFSLSSTPLSLVLNPVATPTPTAVPTPTPTPTTPSSGTPVPTPASGDLTAPTVTIISPVNGTTLTKSVFNINSQASDTSGIQKIEVYFDGGLIKTCGGDTCKFNYQTNRASSGSHTILVKATDNSTNHNVGQSSVIIIK